MSVMKDVIVEEKNRLVSLNRKYEQKIAEYPRGSISVKKKGSHAYCYLAYREGQKVKFLYLGKEGSEKAEEMKQQIEIRHKYEARCKQARENLKEIERLLNVYK